MASATIPSSRPAGRTTPTARQTQLHPPRTLAPIPATTPPALKKETSSKLTANIAALTERTREAREKLARMTAQTEQLKEQCQLQENECAALETEKAKAKEELNTLANKVGDLVSEKTKVEHKLAELKAENDRLEAALMVGHSAHDIRLLLQCVQSSLPLTCTITGKRTHFQRVRRTDQTSSDTKESVDIEYAKDCIIPISTGHPSAVACHSARTKIEALEGETVPAPGKENKQHILRFAPELVDKTNFLIYIVLLQVGM
ncbi:hypothetical protein HDU85_007697 [Gaertneriomyces sp. JEL0708]|nr:hypothetical protein HDU85_007697 [Gaertneriomyces sp. JEL0708]